MPRRLRALFVPFLLFFLIFQNRSLLFSQQNNQPRPKYGGTLRVKTFSNVFRTELDPASPDSFIFITEHLFDGLVKLDKNLSPIGSLAEYWIISNDGREYTFHLRKGVTFLHGEELTSEDVKFSLERIVDRATGSPYYEFFAPKVVGAEDFRNGKANEVEGFKVKDRYTFEIQWTKPHVSCLLLLSMPFCKILPKDLVLERKRRFFASPPGPSGTGPFRFVHWIRSPQGEEVGVRLERNDGYFGGRPYIAVLEFSPHYTLDHFLGREIDIIPVLSEKVLTDEFQVFQNGSLNQSFLGMSCNIPPFDSQPVRKAIAHSINKSAIARAAYSFEYLYELTNNFIPSKLPGFYPLDTVYGHDLEKAKTLLLEAGFTDGEKFPLINLFLESPRTSVQLRIFRDIRDQLADLGIRLRLRYYRTLEEVKNSREPYLVLLKRLMSFPDAENSITPLFSSGSAFNIFNYSNPEVDRLLEEAESTKSWTKKIKIFHELEKTIISDIPALPLFSNQQRIAVQPYVRNIEVPLMGFDYLDVRRVWLDR